MKLKQKAVEYAANTKEEILVTLCSGTQPTSAVCKWNKSLRAKKLGKKVRLVYSRKKFLVDHLHGESRIVYAIKMEWV